MIRLVTAVLALALATPALAKPPTPEARTAAALDRIAGDGARLRLFLQDMPKGADLHNHLGGSVYAEDFLSWADAAGLCIATDTNSIVPPPCDTAGRIPAHGLAADAARYGKTVDAISARGFEQGQGDPTISGHDRFFTTFTGFGAASRNAVGKMIAVTREAAAYDHVAYIELMVIPRAVVDVIPAAMAAGGDGTDFAALATALAPVLPNAVAHARADMDRDEAEVAQIEGCKGNTPSPACAVEVRYLMSALRNLTPAQVFAQLAFGFALAEADPRFVGVNIVAPEDELVPRRDYALHMRMLAFLHARHPTVAMSLHAGELTLGLVPPRDLRFHIHDAVAIGARRIGHGVDIAYEADAADLLKRMARDHIAVEINLTSNAVILGVKGHDHPLALYRSAGVPVTLATDDEGVSRSDMTNEYRRAVMEQGLRYRDLKQIARDGLQYAFLPGPSLWASRVGGPMVAACAGATGCKAFLATSPRAAQQWQLERDFAAFEAKVR